MHPCKFSVILIGHCPIVRWMATTASVQFYNKLDGFHFVCPFGQNVKKGVVYFFEVEYTTESGLPHSKQRSFNRDVINPQDGHILCD